MSSREAFRSWRPSSRQTLLMGLALAGLLAGIGPLFTQGQTAAPVRIGDLAWLAGSWAGEVRGAGATTRFEAHYTSPQGGVILSASKAFKADGQLSWFEFERFEEREGTLVVIPHPNGKASVPFTLVEHDPAAKRAVFANPGHDDPNRITYQRTAEDRLLIRVEGDAPGESSLEFSLSSQ